MQQLLHWGFFHYIPCHYLLVNVTHWAFNNNITAFQNQSKLVWKNLLAASCTVKNQLNLDLIWSKTAHCLDFDKGSSTFLFMDVKLTWWTSVKAEYIMRNTDNTEKCSWNRQHQTLEIQSVINMIIEYPSTCVKIKFYSIHLCLFCLYQCIKCCCTQTRWVVVDTDGKYPATHWRCAMR